MMAYLDAALRYAAAAFLRGEQRARDPLSIEQTPGSVR